MLISFEGIDGTGKATQALLLQKYFESNNVQSEYFDFPAYESFVGKEVGNLLSSDSSNREIDASTLPAKLMAMLFALDRMQFFEPLHSAIIEGKAVITNRFSLSNSVFQTIRAGADISDWVNNLEHDALRLPRPDCYVVLLGDVNSSKKLVASKGGRVYTEERDIYEKDESLLAQAQELYKSISTPQSEKIIVNCLSDGEFRSREDIHIEICNKISKIMNNNANKSLSSALNVVITNLIDQVWKGCIVDYQLDIGGIYQVIKDSSSHVRENLECLYNGYAKTGIFYKIVNSSGHLQSNLTKHDLDLCVFVGAIAYSANTISDLPHYPRDLRQKIINAVCEGLKISNEDLIALDREWGRILQSSQA